LYEFERKTQGSLKFKKEAKQIMPGGVTANIKAFSPHPIAMKKGEGAHLTDIDNNIYIDYLLSYSALILGHGHPDVKAAIYNQIEEKGTWLYGSPHQLEIDFGKLLQNYYSSIEMLRYTNSGTEATLLALRLAKSYTGKQKIAKFEGHYHGGHKQVLFSISPSEDDWGNITHPNAVPDSKELKNSSFNSSIILPFNDLEACEYILEKNYHHIAAIIMEPVQEGFISANIEFMKGIRRITEKLGIVLIFDEVKTGFRVKMGGAQSYYNIELDLTALGKVIGGGFPVGVVGGKSDILMESAPQEKRNKPSDVLFHSGTYNGHPMILSAGIATIKVLENKINDIFNMTEYLKSNLKDIFNEKGIESKILGIGSMFNIALTNRDIMNFRDYQSSDFSLRKKIDLALLNEGVYNKPCNRYSLSIYHNYEVLNKTLYAYKKVLSTI